MNDEPTVYLVDNDPTALNALSRLLCTKGYAVQMFDSTEEFLPAYDPAVSGCVVLDVRMPGIDGLALQQALMALSGECFIVFVSSQGDVAASVQAMKAGAVDFLTKPLDDERFFAAVRAAIERNRDARRSREATQSIRRRVESLTPREYQVLEHVVTGRLNKQIAADLGIAEKTVKVHRARVMEKMGAASLAEIVRMIIEIGIATGDRLLPKKGVQPKRTACPEQRADGCGGQP